MNALILLTPGATYGRLTVISQDRQQVLCSCSCGSLPPRAYDLSRVRRGVTQSCGCLRKEAMSRIGALNATHKHTNTPVFHAWLGMIARCHSPSNKDYWKYGERGIFVCDRWRSSFDLFLSDMGEKPSTRHSIDRKDNDGPYSPDNCRWATKTEQTRNRRNTARVVIDGQSVVLAELCDQNGARFNVAFDRIRRGWPVEKALSLPVGAAPRGLEKALAKSQPVEAPEQPKPEQLGLEEA